MVVNNNTFARLARSAEGRQRAAVANGVAEDYQPDLAREVKKPQSKKSSRPAQREFHSRAPIEESSDEERVRLREQAEQEAYYESIRNTEADPRHPEDRGWWERELADAQAGISLANFDGANTQDEQDFTTGLRRSNPR